MMRFRLRDVLLAMALLAAYLTVFRYALVVMAEEGEFESYPTQTTLALILAIYPLVFWAMRKRAISKASQIVFVAEPLRHWTPLNSTVLVLPAIVFLAVINVFRSRSVFFGGFGGSAVALLMIFFTMFFNVKFGTGGIVYGVYFYRWKEKHTVRNADDTVVQWRLSSSVSFEIPPEHQSQITELCDQHLS